MLTNILTYHVIGDQAVDAATAISLDGSDVEMLNGDTVSVSVQDGTLYLKQRRDRGRRSRYQWRDSRH